MRFRVSRTVRLTRSRVWTTRTSPALACLSASWSTGRAVVALILVEKDMLLADAGGRQGVLLPGQILFRR